MRKAAGWVDIKPSQLLGAALAGGGIGVGVRGLRHLYDISQGRDVNPPAPLEPAPSNKIRMPLPVSADEAAELERQGVKVRRAIKQAYTLLDAVGMGATGVGAGMLGWKALDQHLDAQRRAVAQKRLDRVRGRVQSLLSDQPMPEDVPLHAAMKAAEAHYFGQPKTAGLGDLLGRLSNTVASAGVNTLAPLGFPLAIGGTLLGLSAYNDTRKANKYQAAAKAIRDHYERQPTRPPEAELEPVLVDDQPKPKVAAIGARLKGRLHGRPAR